MFSQVNQNQFYELRIQHLQQIINQKDLEIAFLKQRLNSLGININSHLGFINNMNNIMNQNPMMFENNPINNNIYENNNKNNYDFIKDYGFINVKIKGIKQEQIECFIYDKAIKLMKKISEQLNKNLKDLKFFFLGDLIKELKPQLTLAENGIYDNSVIEVRERSENELENKLIDNISYEEKTKFGFLNLVFVSNNPTGNKCNIVLNENIPIGIALILYLIKSGRERDLFDIIQNKSNIYFLFNSQKISITDKTRIKNFFSFDLQTINVVKYKSNV